MKKPGIERMRDQTRRLVEYYRSVVGPDCDHEDLLRLAQAYGGPDAVRDLREALSLVETPVQSMAVVIGRFDPPVKEAMAFVRKLAGQNDKVILAVMRGGMPFEAKGQLVGIQCPDLERKLEIHDVGDPADVSEALTRVAQSGKSVYRGENAVNVYPSPGMPARVRKGALVDMSAALVHDGAPAQVDGSPKAIEAIDNPKEFIFYLDPRANNQPQAVAQVCASIHGDHDIPESLDEEGVADAHGGEEDPHGLQKALSTVPQSERKKRLSQFGRWARIQDNRAALALYRVTVDEEDPYLDVGGDYVLTCRVFILPVEEFSRQTGRAGQGTGHIVDAELFFRDVDGKEPFLWHNETRVQSRQEAVERVKAVQRWLDGRTIDQLASDRKSGALQMSKFGEQVQEDISAGDQSPLKALGGPEAVKAILLAKVQPLANQKGIRVSSLRPVGSGDNGVAFDMGGGKCLKVTVDEDEAQAAWNLRGKGGQHINRFYDVFRIQKVPSPVYCIVSDLLKSLSEQEAADFTEVMSKARLRVVERDGKISDENTDFIDTLAKEPWATTWAKIQASIMQDVRDEMKLSADAAPRLTKRAELIGQQRSQEVLQGLERFKVPEMVEELRKAGVQFADFHAGNILKRGSDYVLNDLSRAKSGPADIEDLTEWMESSPRISSVSAWSSGMMALMNRPTDDEREETEDDEDRDTGGPARSVDRLEFR